MKLSLFTVFLFSLLSVSAQHKMTKPEIGIVADFEQDSLLHANGYKYLVESIVKCFSPIKISDEQFDLRLKEFRSLHLSVFAMNIFMPGDMKLVGPDVKEEVILSYAKAVFERCQRVPCHRQRMKRMGADMRIKASPVIESQGASIRANSCKAQGSICRRCAAPRTASSTISRWAWWAAAIR